MIFFCAGVAFPAFFTCVNLLAHAVLFCVDVPFQETISRPGASLSKIWFSFSHCLTLAACLSSHGSFLVG
jgi:hypothetical protein